MTTLLFGGESEEPKEENKIEQAPAQAPAPVIINLENNNSNQQKQQQNSGGGTTVVHEKVIEKPAPETKPKEEDSW